MKKLPISVVIITLNEEKHIYECLKSVKFADEIILVDSFSNDKTVKIAKKNGCKIFKRKFNGFGNLKNYGIGKAKNLWILNIDADERVTEELREEIENVLKNPKYDGYYIPRKSFIGKKWIKYAGQWPDYQLRLFRKDKGRFENKLVHERVIVKGKVNFLKNPLLHYNFRNWDEVKIKTDRYSTKEAESLLNKKFVFFYPKCTIKKFIKIYIKLIKKNKNPIHSYLSARNILYNYKVKWFIPFEPWFNFLRFYFIQLGFMDGFLGLRWCLEKIVYTFLVYSKYNKFKKQNSVKIINL